MGAYNSIPMTVGILTTSAALDGLGAQPELLTAADRRALDEDGYLVIPDAIDADHVARLRARFDELIAEEGDEAGIEVHQEAGASRLADLVNKGPVFDVCWTHPKQLAAVAHVLGGREMRLSSLNGRAALPGAGLQGLHADWGRGVEPGDFYVCNSLWMLDEFTAENGATRVVPGSHLSRSVPKDALDDPIALHPDERIVTGTAGTVVVFNSHLWHGGRLNRSERPRHALHGYFGRRDTPQQLVQRDYIRAETVRRLSPAALYLLDVA